MQKYSYGSFKNYSLDYYTGFRVQKQGAVHPCPPDLCTQLRNLVIKFGPAGKRSHLLYLIHMLRPKAGLKNIALSYLRCLIKDQSNHILLEQNRPTRSTRREDRQYEIDTEIKTYLIRYPHAWSCKRLKQVTSTEQHHSYFICATIPISFDSRIQQKSRTAQTRLVNKARVATIRALGVLINTRTISIQRNKKTYHHWQSCCN